VLVFIHDSIDGNPDLGKWRQQHQDVHRSEADCPTRSRVDTGKVLLLGSGGLGSPVVGTARGSFGDGSGGKLAMSCYQ
jgi:hypothetical protein